MENLERELTELNSRLDQTEAEKDSLEKKVVGLGAEIARLNKSSELAQALLKASEGITDVSDHATQASDDMEDVRPPSFSIPPVSPILVVANPAPDSTSSVVGVTPSTTRYAESASDPYFFLYSDEEDDDNDEEKEVSNHGEGEEKEEIEDKGKGKEKKSSMGSGMAPQTKQMSADQGLTTNETKDKLDHATYAQVSPNPGAKAYYASPAFTQYPGPHATSGAYHPANAPHTTPYGAPQPQVFRRIVRGISPYAPAYPSASTYPRSDYPVYQPSQNARHPPASLASGRKSGFRYGRGYGAAYGCLPMKRA